MLCPSCSSSNQAEFPTEMLVCISGRAQESGQTQRQGEPEIISLLEVRLCASVNPGIRIGTACRRSALQEREPLATRAFEQPPLRSHVKLAAPTAASSLLSAFAFTHVATRAELRSASCTPRAHLSQLPVSFPKSRLTLLTLGSSLVFC